MTTKQALITLLIFMVTIPLLLHGMVILTLWMGGRR